MTIDPLSREFAALVQAYVSATPQASRSAWDALAEFVVENNQDITAALKDYELPFSKLGQSPDNIAVA